MAEKKQQKEALKYEEAGAMEINQQITNAYASGVVDTRLGENPYKKVEQERYE